MFRRSSVIFTASLALLSTLDSATCFAAAAPAQPREDLERPRFLKKEIKRFVFTNTTTSRGPPPDESSTPDLEALLQDALTSSSSQDLGADATPTSATPTITIAPSVTQSDNEQSSSSDVSLSLTSDNDADSDAFLSLYPSTTTTTPVSSASPPSSTLNDGEGATTQSSIVSEGNSNGITGSSQSPPSTSASYSGQSNENGVVPQTTHSSTVEPSGNGVTPSQLGSTGQPETSASPSSATVTNSHGTPQDSLDVVDQTSGSTASETSVLNAVGQGPSTLGSQTPPSTGQQTDTQVQPDETQGVDALHSSLSSEGAGTPPATTSIVGSPSLALAAGETIKSNSEAESDRFAGAVTTTTGSLESPPVTTAGAGPPVVAPTAGTTIESNANDDADHLVTGLTTATSGSPPAATSAEDSLAAVPGETIETSQATSGIPAPNTKTDNEVSTNTYTNGNDAIPTTLGGGAGAATTNVAQPASSPFAPQSVVVPATGTNLGAEASQVTAGPGDTQSTLTPGFGAGPTSQNGGILESSASTALQPNPEHASSQVEGSLLQTTLGDGQVVPNTAQITGAGEFTGTPLATPPASVSSPGGEQKSNPNPNPGATEAASIFNPSLAAAASKLNAIPASIENPLATVSGNPPLVLNPALTAAASVLGALPASIQNPEHQVSLPGSPASASPVISGGSSSPGGIPPDTAGATASSVGTGPPITVSPPGETESPIGTASPTGGTESFIGTGSPTGGSASLVGGTASPAGTGSSIGATGSPVVGTVPPVGETGSLTDGTASSVGATGSIIGTTAPPVGATGSSVGETASSIGRTGSPVGGTESPVGATGSSFGENGSPTGVTGSSVVGTESPVATGTPVGGTGSLNGGTGSPVATGSQVGETGLPLETESAPVSGAPTPGQVSGGLVPSSGNTHQIPSNTAPVSGVPESGPITASNGQVIHGTPAPTPQSATPESGIAGYSTQSNGNVVPISAAAGTGSTVSNGQVVPVATGHEASAQSPGPNETGAAAASSAAQSAAANAAGATQNTAVPPGPTATPVVPQHQQFSGKGPYTQSPVGYDTSTTQVVPTNIIHGPSSTPSATQGHYFGPSSLPSNVPQILYQNGGPGSQPPNTRLINIAFRYPLNYLFVYNHTVSQQQIFHYIPWGICYGLEIEISQITMQSLRAWDTYEDLGYVTTLALAWIPEGLVDNLALLVETSVSRFYNNPDNSTAFLLSMINNAIPITGSNSTDGASTPFGNIPTDTSSTKNAGAPIGGDIGNSEHVRASSVGIGVGVACGAAAYGAAMFFVARRYKKRRQSHLRSPSMFSSPVMSHAGPDAGAGAALMSGAMGERSASPYYDNDGRAGSRGSGRSGSSRHQISAPVMAENSLGWN
ncbi:MAG: hypothetical protein ASARMPREDX12_003663 [Alectoria sarmentosa]|nr:MAG: hypothetical protein ASARMPRED_008029 [Alectoria sarmentosa]CAD6570525.1 MAG: hypothetical protein ASARMPREDX12_003663 [Alectoria sarmentosa]